MSNATNKSLTSLCLTVLLATTSCGSEYQAKELLSQAESSIKQQQYTTAIDLIDSIDRTYPDALDTRRKAMAIKTIAIEEQTKLEYSLADSLATVNQCLYDSIVDSMTKVNTPEPLEEYWIAKEGGKSKILSGNGIEARVSEKGDFYIISSLKPSKIGHTTFTLSTSDGENVSAPIVLYDNELNFRINDSETITYIPGSCDDIGKFAANHRNAPITLTFKGEKGNKTVKLTASQVNGLATAWEFATILKNWRQWSIERERLNQRLIIARDQKARLSACDSQPTD